MKRSSVLGSGWVALMLGAVTFVSCVPAGGDASAQGAATEPRLAPDFELSDLAGEVVRLSDSAGDVRLVDFWATWCTPCREEIPMFKELHDRYGSQGFTLLAVSMDLDGPDPVREFIEEHAIPYTNLMGTDEVGEEFGGVLGLPTAFLVDGDGRIVEEYFGPKSPRKLERRIRDLLGLAPEA